MKNIFKIGALMLLTAGVFTSCDPEAVVFSDVDFVQLSNDAAVSIVENSGGSVSVTAILGGPRSSDVTVSFDVTGDASRFTLTPGNTVTIPAGETSGTLTFTPIDDDDINGDIDVVIALSESNTLGIGIGGGGFASVSKTITIVDDNVPCNDVLVSVTTDRWGDETSWEITDGSGSVLASGGPYSFLGAGESATYDTVVNLADGCYTFTLFDAYGDGQDYGSYIVTCGAIIHAQGAGALSGGGGFFESTDFCVNQ